MVRVSSKPVTTLGRGCAL